MLVPTAILGLAALSAAADNAIYVGSIAKDLPDSLWKSVSDNPTNSSSAKFPGFDLSKPFPSEKQEGWTLSIAVKHDLKSTEDGNNLTATTMSITAPNNISNADDSWHVCVYAFKARESSTERWTSGRNPSCHGLVADECIDDLQKNGVEKFGGDACPEFRSTASCIRDIEEQTGLALSVSASDASSIFGNGTSFYRRVDGVYKDQEGAKTSFQAGADQPMAILTVWGSSRQSNEKPSANVACVMPNARTATSGASHIATGFIWSVVASVALALPFVL